MNIGKPRKLGKTIGDIEEGDLLSLIESIEDKDLLFYLGLTNDASLLCIQRDYAQKIEYEEPIVPLVMLMEIIANTISEHLPRPGSRVVNFPMNFVGPVFHYETLTFQLEVIKVDKMKDMITISVQVVNEQEDHVLDTVVMVQPPQVAIDELTEKGGTLTCE